ncbi:MAG: CDP-diacylglycerol--serine O-phosphatidyltransferase [Bacteroidales bacterium]|nr:CDP-diacylglycerol--serine O-phosphatidyltransferase [Bacteroidales bacterium]
MSVLRIIPNTITLMNLLSGVVGVILTLSGNPAAGLPCMLAAAGFDFLDGLAARLLNVQSPIGKELDSLADVVSFGVLPAVILYMVVPGPMWLKCVPLLLAAFSALRLAKFNVDTRQESNFIGLPTPASALLAASFCHYSISGASPYLQSNVGWLAPSLALALCALVVSDLPMFGMKVKKGHRLLDTKRMVFIGFSVAAVVVTVVFSQPWSLAPLLIFTFYVLENSCLNFIHN